jgi:zinc protease
MISALAAPECLSSLPGRLRVERLANGLTVALLENRQAPLVTSALYYRAGTRDEAPGQGGIAHFLEHMMFKGAGRYGPGEIDRVTQSLGGANNAFTSHDATTYYFNFAADRWTEALRIEADRMAGLALLPEAVGSERQVILEEIAMYESEPWDALEVAVHARLFSGHPYGKAVLGTREELLAIGPAELRAFHRRLYRPGNAVLVVSGEIDDGALPAIEETLGALPAHPELDDSVLGGPSPERNAPASRPPRERPHALERVERIKGEVARLMLALPAPAGSHPDHPALRMATILLGGGRMSRLQRPLVDDEQLCAWLSVDLSEGLDASLLVVAAEVVPDVEPARVEARVLELIAELRRRPPGASELERCRRIAHADWVFDHEKLHQQALSLGLALALFDLDHLDGYLERLQAVGIDEVLDAAERYLRPEKGAVLGWSLPKS